MHARGHPGLAFNALPRGCLHPGISWTDETSGLNVQNFSYREWKTAPNRNFPYSGAISTFGYSSSSSSSILMRRDFRNFKSWSLILSSELVLRVETREVLSVECSPCLLTPMVASSTRKMS